MSVIVLIKFHTDQGTLEAKMRDQPATFEALAAEFRSCGCMHHRLAVRGNELLVIDEWKSVGDFDTFYPDHPGLLEVLDDLGLEAAPEISYWDPMPDPGAF
jgi:hypothetical protein